MLIEANSIFVLRMAFFLQDQGQERGEDANRYTELCSMSI